MPDHKISINYIARIAYYELCQLDPSSVKFGQAQKPDENLTYRIKHKQYWKAQQLDNQVEQNPHDIYHCCMSTYDFNR